MNLTNKAQKGFKRPHVVASKIKKAYNHRNSSYNLSGIDIFSEEWDNLIILDSCRYDYFSRYNHFDGKTEYRVSRGSTTREFIRGNFQSRDRYDTVYCSSNGWYKKISEELNDARSDVFRFEWLKGSDVRELGNVRERDNNLTKTALKLQEKYPNKRLIVHYLSPHEPYVDIHGNVIMQTGYHAKSKEKKHPDTHWYLIKRNSDKKNYIGIGEIRQAYEQSIQYILNHISNLVEELNGFTVITADHGELLGERLIPFPFFGFSHPEGIYMDELVKVPWFKCNYSERKKIIEEDEPHHTMEKSREVTEDVNEHLKNMGYKL